VFLQHFSKIDQEDNISHLIVRKNIMAALRGDTERYHCQALGFIL